MEIISRIARNQLPNHLGDHPVTPPATLYLEAANVEAPHWFATSRSRNAVPYADAEHIGRICADAMRVMGFDSDDVLLNMNAPEPHLSGFAGRQAVAALGATSYNDHFDDYHRVFETEREGDVTAVSSIPSKAIELAEEIEDRFGPPDQQFQSLTLGMFGGEPLRQDVRERVTDRWGLKRTREFYGSSETTLVAVGMDETRQLVPLLNHFVIEVEIDGNIRDIREFDRPAVGSILITDPSREAVDVTRYRQGDVIRVHPASDIPRIEPLGRADDAFLLDGAVVHPMDVEAAIHAGLGRETWWIIHVKDNEDPIEIELYVTNHSNDGTELLLEELFRRIPALRHAVGTSADERIHIELLESASALPKELATNVDWNTPIRESELRQ